MRGGKDCMGEKNTPAAGPKELPQVRMLQEKLLQESVMGGTRAASQAPAMASAPNNNSPATFSIPPEYFDQIIENAPQPISIVDDKHCVLRVNAEFTRLFGYTAEEIAGRNLPKLLVPPDRYAETSWIQQNVSAGRKLTLETRRQRKDGSLVELLLSMNRSELG